jgi:hypothetical protein
VVVTAVMVAARGYRIVVGLDDFAWQLPVRRGTASEDGACSNNTVR